MNREEWVLGQWNAYVETGASLEERRERLSEVPESWRDAVRSHVTLVFQLKDAAKDRERQKQARRARW